MKILGRIDGSISGAIRSHSSVSRAILQSAAAQGENGTNRKLTAAAGSRLSWRTQDLGCTGCGWTASRRGNTTGSRSTYSTVATPGGRRPLSPIYFTSCAPSKRKRNHTSSAAVKQSLPAFAALPPPKRSREEMLAFLDYYDDDITVEDQLEFLKDPYRRRYASPETPQLSLTENQHQLLAPLPDDVLEPDQETREIMTRLRTAIFNKLLRPNSTKIDDIYDLYRSLPEPRMSYLTGALRHKLLAVLAITHRRNPKSMLRYFAVVADVKSAGFALSRTEWNTAVSFASRYVGNSGQTEAEAALHLWREMEHDAGIMGNEVTFNILFDVAAKSGKFALAEMTYQEMTSRGFQFNRYHHTSLIHFFGLKMDSSGVRAAYKEIVQHGEVVDTIVLNCVIASLLRCGEEASAEYVYRKMKAADDRSKLIPHRDYTFNKMINKVLVMFGCVGRKHPDLSRTFQSVGMVTPDLSTYRILLNYYGVRLGQMSKVAAFLDEMKFFRVPLHGSVFLALFKGFAAHGDHVGSAWSVKRLVDVYHAYLDAFDGGADSLYLNTWMAMWILRAFAKCTGSREEVLAVYEELRVRWPEDQATDAFMLEFLHHLLLKSGLQERDLASLP
ncbi:mitochondrial ribosomal small subunit component [Pestalotiopsis sp. IQ-011]